MALAFAPQLTYDLLCSIFFFKIIERKEILSLAYTHLATVLQQNVATASMHVLQYGDIECCKVDV